jgi:hypothetical protein
MARGTGGNTGGIGLGGILVIVGIVLMIVWSFWVGLAIVPDLDRVVDLTESPTVGVRWVAMKPRSEE